MTEQATRHELAPAATRSLSRRQVVKAGAWAAPVMAVAIATPGAAASTRTITVSLNATSAPAGNNKLKWTITVTITNNSQTVISPVATVSVTAFHAASWDATPPVVAQTASNLPGVKPNSTANTVVLSGFTTFTTNNAGYADLSVAISGLPTGFVTGGTTTFHAG